MKAWEIVEPGIDGLHPVDDDAASNAKPPGANDILCPTDVLVQMRANAIHFS